MALEDITNRPRFARVDGKNSSKSERPNAFKPRFGSTSGVAKVPKFALKSKQPLKVRFKPPTADLPKEPKLPVRGGPLTNLIKARTAELNALRVGVTEPAPASVQWNKFCDLSDGKVILCANSGRTDKVTKYADGVYIYA